MFLGDELKPQKCSFFFINCLWLWVVISGRGPQIKVFLWWGLNLMTQNHLLVVTVASDTQTSPDAVNIHQSYSCASPYNWIMILLYSFYEWNESVIWPLVQGRLIYLNWNKILIYLLESSCRSSCSWSVTPCGHFKNCSIFFLHLLIDSVISEAE